MPKSLKFSLKSIFAVASLVFITQWHAGCSQDAASHFIAHESGATTQPATQPADVAGNVAHAVKSGATTVQTTAQTVADATPPGNPLHDIALLIAALSGGVVALETVITGIVRKQADGTAVASATSSNPPKA